MRKLVLAVSLALTAAPALAQVEVEVKVKLPAITFTVAPPLVVVAPGVQVVPDHDEEVFFVDGWYWVRHDGHWYRARDHKGGWVVVASPGVPAVLVKIPPGHYKRWKPAKAAVKVKLKKEKKGKHGRD